MKLKHSILTALLATGLSFGMAQANQLEDVMKAGTLRCAVYADVPPFSAPDPQTRELVGFDVDLCKAVGEELGLKVELKPISVEARITEIQQGRVDITVANLAYTNSRAEQIQFSDPYYIAKEMLLVPADDPRTTKEEFAGERIASTKGSTSELSIRNNNSTPITFQDTASVYLAVQQDKARGMVANTMTITKLVADSQTSGRKMKMIETPMLRQPTAIGMRKGEPEFTARINEALYALDDKGKIDEIWNKWVGPDTAFNMVRTEKVAPLSELDHDDIP